MRRVVAFFAREVKWTISAVTFAPALVLLATLAVSILVPIDGIIYISGAKSILTPDFAHFYPLYREPLYPLFLKAIHFFGSAALYVVIVQSALTATAGLMALYSVQRLAKSSRPKVWQLVLLWLILANPMFLGYSGAFLQQALFTFQLAGFGFLLSLALVPTKSLRTWVLVMLVLCWYLLGIATSVGWIYLGILPVATVLVVAISRPLRKLTKTRFRFRHLSSGLIAVLAVGVIIGSYVLGTFAFSIWDNYKKPFIANSSAFGYVIKPLDSVPSIPSPVAMGTRVLALMDMTVVPPYEKENIIFMQWQKKQSLAYDWRWVGAPFSSYAPAYFDFSSPGQLIRRLYYGIQESTLVVLRYQAVFAIMWISFIPLLWLRRWKQIAFFVLIPVNFLFVYAASNSPIDRYGIPAYAMAAASVPIFISALVEIFGQLKKRFSRRHEA